MNTIAIVLTGVYLGLAVLLAIRLPWALLQNIQTGIRFRKTLSSQIASLRLGKMLSRLGITNNAYLYNQRTHKIRHHINQCETCEHADTCDVRLDDTDEIANDVATYCPNAEDLIAIKNKPNINECETM